MNGPDAIGFLVIEIQAPGFAHEQPDAPARYDMPSAAHAAERYRREKSYQHNWPLIVVPASHAECFGLDLPELT